MDRGRVILHDMPESTTRAAPGAAQAAQPRMDRMTASCVLLADAHHALNERVCGLLKATFGQVFMVADEPSLIEGAARLRPTMSVIDLSLAAGDLGGMLLKLRGRAPESKVLLISVHDEPTVLAAAYAAGADGLVLKRAIATDLLDAIDAVLAGKRHFSHSSIP